MWASFIEKNSIYFLSHTHIGTTTSEPDEPDVDSFDFSFLAYLTLLPVPILPAKPTSASSRSQFQDSDRIKYGWNPVDIFRSRTLVELSMVGIRHR